MSLSKRKALYVGLFILILAAALYVFSGPILTGIGEFLVVNEGPVPSDAVVVLNTGMEYYPRLIEGATLFKKGLVSKIVINGNRKTDVFRSFERMGFKSCCPWYEGRLRILELLGVPRKNVIYISVEDAYDTVSEAKAVGSELIKERVRSIIIATSKSHTRRARHIWKSIYPHQFKILMVAAHSDPYSPQGWWKEGRQIRWVLSEYGAWLYLLWKNMRDL